MKRDIEVDEGRGTSQNIPVNPGSHSHMTEPSSSSTHSPFVQLTKSHREMFIGVGDGVRETRRDDGEEDGTDGDVMAEEEKGISKLCELGTMKLTIGDDI